MMKLPKLFLFAVALELASCQSPTIAPLADHALLPYPNTVRSGESALNINTIQNLSIDADFSDLGQQIAQEWEMHTTNALEVTEAENAQLRFSLDDQVDGSEEAYSLEIDKKKIVIKAKAEVGLFRAWQTLKQLITLRQLTPEKDYLPTGVIQDNPVYAYRGTMLDVSRHFFSVDEVKRYIDLIAPYKINYLHLHLSDDQGWRIEIKSWPELTRVGGSTEVGGGEGGFYTQEQYKELVDYAQKQFITLVPEIDMPGHTNAALASYAELNCNGKATDLYTGTEVGFSTLCVEKEVTYQFVEDVIRELSAMTPGPYIHIGGDESHVTPKKDFITFINRVYDIVPKYNKIPIGWDEVQLADMPQPSVAQYWANAENALAAKQKGAKILISPAAYAYLDMKYDSLTVSGLKWAGYVPLEKGYSWNPDALVDGIENADILGVEAPLWSETISNSPEMEYLAFPRLLGYAEIGWTMPSIRQWEAYKKRLAVHGKLLDQKGVNYYKSPAIAWE